MKKSFKWLGALAGVAAAAGLLITFLRQKGAKTKEEADETAEEEFDLDADLKSASEREYVSLGKAAEDLTEPSAPEQTDDEEPSEEPSDDAELSDEAQTDDAEDAGESEEEDEPDDTDVETVPDTTDTEDERPSV